MNDFFSRVNGPLTQSPHQRHALQEHIVSLARTDVQERIQQLKSIKSSSSDFEYTAAKEHVLRRLQRLIPGNTSSSLGAVFVAGIDEIITQPERMAKVLSDHWQTVFSYKRIDQHKLQQWLSQFNERLPFSGDPAEYTPSLLEVENSIKLARETAPGPDGIPVRVWKRLSSFAAPIFQKVLGSLFFLSEQEVAEAYPLFNEAFLTCLGKKPSFTIGSENVFEVSATRPLSVVNTDNRILANALRLTITPKAETWVSPQQRGFISGRYLLANVVDIDFEAMRVSLSHSRGVLVLFDFRAAFPSLAHDYLWNVLEKLGTPPPLIRALRCFYVNNFHTMKLKGRRFPSITSQSGIRQGCPLSPLLFAIVVDLFLRRLDTLFPHECTRAFADDIAMVLHNFDSSAELLMSDFANFAPSLGYILVCRRPYSSRCGPSTRDHSRVSCVTLSQLGAQPKSKHAANT